MTVLKCAAIALTVAFLGGCVFEHGHDHDQGADRDRAPPAYSGSSEAAPEHAAPPPAPDSGDHYNDQYHH
ncbi:MAG TPA: hypothetical protein VLV50_01070 [Stellaceae bacterium]|nr:hypothetical protein [Stellaceae bacterium]